MSLINLEDLMKHITIIPDNYPLRAVEDKLSDIIILSIDIVISYSSGLFETRQ